MSAALAFTWALGHTGDPLAPRDERSRAREARADDNVGEWLLPTLSAIVVAIRRGLQRKRASRSGTDAASQPILCKVMALTQVEAAANAGAVISTRDRVAQPYESSHRCVIEDA